MDIRMQKWFAALDGDRTYCVCHRKNGVNVSGDLFIWEKDSFFFRIAVHVCAAIFTFQTAVCCYHNCKIWQEQTILTIFFSYDIM